MERSLLLVEVTLETRLGSVYVFPDMPAGTVVELLHNNNILLFPTLVLVNQSMASFSIPTRLVKTVKVNGEVAWTAPQSPE